VYRWDRASFLPIRQAQQGSSALGLRQVLAPHRAPVGGLLRKASAWGQTYYQQKRTQGMTHACALRCLGQKLLKILYRMLVTRKPYDGELHSRNQQKHGSWVLSLVNKRKRPVGRIIVLSMQTGSLGGDEREA